MGPYYQDDHCTIYHGDCLELADLWTCADILVTDPPYGIAWSRGENVAKSSAAHAGIQNDLDTTHRDEALTLWGERPAIAFGSLYAPRPEPLRHICVWEKPNDAGVYGSTTVFRRDIEGVFLLGEWPKVNVRRGSVLHSAIRNVGNPSSPAGLTGHPHAKPTDLLRDLIAVCPPGVVADPFMGSGTTLRAAKDLGRKAIGIEIEERYCEIAAKRLAQEVLPL